MQTQTEESMSGVSSPDSDLHESRELDHTVESIVALLQQAARGHHTAWALSEAMASIMSPRRRTGTLRLNQQQRDRLLDATTSAYLTAKDALPPHGRRSRIDSGMEALAGLIIYWGSDEKLKATWHPHMYPDLVAYARILRNELHNLCLLEEIAERAEKRRSTVIKHLLLPDGGAHRLN